MIKKMNAFVYLEIISHEPLQLRTYMLVLTMFGDDFNCQYRFNGLHVHGRQVQMSSGIMNDVNGLVWREFPLYPKCTFPQPNNNNTLFQECNQESFFRNNFSLKCFCVGFSLKRF